MLPLLWHGFDPWPRNFCMPRARPKKKKAHDHFFCPSGMLHLTWFVRKKAACVGAGIGDLNEQWLSLTYCKKMSLFHITFQTLLMVKAQRHWAQHSLKEQPFTALPDTATRWDEKVLISGHRNLFWVPNVVWSWPSFAVEMPSLHIVSAALEICHHLLIFR